MKIVLKWKTVQKHKITHNLLTVQINKYANAYLCLHQNNKMTNSITRKNMKVIMEILQTPKEVGSHLTLIKLAKSVMLINYLNWYTHHYLLLS